MTYNISEIDFTTKSQALQLKLNLNTEVYVKDNGKVLLVQNIMERMGLKEIRIAPLLEGILEQFTLMLVENGLVDLSSVYIDGTKIESVSNKYRFVWRGSVEKHQAKLHAKIKETLSLSADACKEDIRKAVKKAWNHCREECKKQKIVFVYGSGKRKTEVQREYEKYEEWLEKLKAHEKLWKVNG